MSFLFLLFWSVGAHACSCDAPSFPDDVKAASIIFRGTASKLEPAGDFLRRVTFTVAQTWKGNVTVPILAQHAPSICETGFVSGSEYLVLVSGEKPVAVDICSNTKLASEAAKEIAYLEKKFPAAKPAKPARRKVK